MATILQLKAAVAKAQHLVDVYAAAGLKGKLNAHQQGNLAIDLKTLAVDLAALAAADPAVDASWFIPVPDPDVAYIVGGSPANPNGVSFTVAQAIAWFTHVVANGIGYHHVRSTLLPGSHCLTPAGLAAVRAFEQRSDLTEAPEDFNPLGLPVVP